MILSVPKILTKENTLATLKIKGRLRYFKQRLRKSQGEMAKSGKAEKSLNRINRVTLY